MDAVGIQTLTAHLGSGPTVLVATAKPGVTFVTLFEPQMLPVFDFDGSMFDDADVSMFVCRVTLFPVWSLC